jgi:predicted phage terminase large subunit-like protein
MHAWRRRLRFSSPKVMPETGESAFHFRARQQKSWGLTDWVADTCIKFKADRLLIEAKASGISAAQTLQDSHPRAGWGIQLIDPKGLDKVARALAVQPSFSQGMVYVPYPLREWGEKVTEEMAVFPKGRYKDLTDAMTQGIKHLRDNGMLRSDDEVRIDQREALLPKKKLKPLYPTARA